MKGYFYICFYLVVLSNKTWYAYVLQGTLISIKLFLKCSLIIKREMESQLKIVYCIPAINEAGGMERVLSLKANYFAQHFGYQIYIVTTEGRTSSSFYHFHSSIKIHDLDIHFDAHVPVYKRFFIHAWKRFLYKRRLNQYLNRVNPDITIAMLRREVGFLASMTDGSVKIAESHFYKDRFLYINPQISSFLPKYIWNFWIKKNVGKLNKLSTFVVLTQEDKELWNELDNVIVIPNPMSFVSSSFSTCINHDVIAAGRYVYQKGFDMLISAWQEVTSMYPDWKLHIWGEGMLRDQLQKQIDAASIGNTCFLEGRSDDIAEKYVESSIFVLSSRFEGFGMVLIEAMACGIPVVSFTCPCGPRDIIQDGVNGLWVENGNVHELSRKIIYLIEHEDLRRRMGQNSAESISPYQIEKIALQWKELFEKLHKEHCRLLSNK